MPQTELEQALLARPAITPNPKPLPPGDPNDMLGMVSRGADAFINGPFTEPTPGANSVMPELVGGAAGLLNLGNVLKLLKGLKGNVAGKVAKTFPGIKPSQLDSRISGLPPARGSGRPEYKIPTSGYEDVLARQKELAPPHYPIYPVQPKK